MAACWSTRRWTGGTGQTTVRCVEDRVLGTRGVAILEGDNTYRPPVRTRARRSGTAVVTIGAGSHAELVDIALPLLRRYAERHGHDLHVVSEAAASQRPVSWSKVAVLRELLDEYERVAWIDADAVIVDGRHDITRLATRAHPIAVVAHRYDGLTIPNLGVIALRSCYSTKRALERVWRLTKYIDHKWWENAAMLELLGYDVDGPRSATRRRRWLHTRVRYIDVAWNSIDLDSSPAPRIVHFPGTAHAVRVERMRHISAVAAASDW